MHCGATHASSTVAITGVSAQALVRCCVCLMVLSRQHASLAGWLSQSCPPTPDPPRQHASLPGWPAQPTAPAHRTPASPEGTEAHLHIQPARPPSPALQAGRAGADLG